MLSNYLRGMLADAVCGNGPFALPSAYWVKLHLGAPGRDGLLLPAVDTRRMQVLAWDPQVDGVCYSVDPLEWNNCPVDEEFTHASLWDDELAGLCLAADPLLVPKQVSAGDTMRLNTVGFRMA